jgi:hypothetical protein
MLSGVDPTQLGLSGYSNDQLYEGVYNQYKDKMKKTFEKYQKLVKAGIL